jgi:DNA-binding MarR family transcriptional regulator
MDLSTIIIITIIKMALKKTIKKNEARLIVYLSQVHRAFRYKSAMSTKLGIGYGYLSQTIAGMMHKGWVKKVQTLNSNKVYYVLTQQGQEKLAASKILLDETEVIENGEQRVL